MIINKLDSIKFRLKELHDFTWLKKYGTAFWVIDETGSGCSCIGMEDAQNIKTIIQNRLTKSERQSGIYRFIRARVSSNESL